MAGAAPPTSDQITRSDALRRGYEVALRSLGLALERALMAFEDPKKAAEPQLARLTQLDRDGEALGREAPGLRGYVTELSRSSRASANALVARAEAAHRQRGRVDGRFQTAYNGVVGPALAQAPGQGTTALRGQVERAVRQLVDQVVPGEVPGDVKGTMTRELSSWVLQQAAVEDAFFVVERTLTQVARFLHEKLTLHGQLVALKDDTAGRGSLTTEQAHAADARAGQLARRSVELDELIKHQIEQQALTIRGYVRLNPKLVLDPTKRFLERLDAQAGITIRRDQVRVDLGTRLQVTNPLMFDGSSQVGVSTHLDLRVGRDLSVGASYGGTFQNGRFGDEQFKVSLTWRF